MKKVLIIPQLDQHHTSTKLLLDELTKNEYIVDILNLGEYYNSSEIGNVKLKFSSILGYKYGNTRLILRQLVDRIIYLLNIFFIIKLVKRYNNIIIFSEPLIIRGIIYFASVYNSKTHLIMEGMRSEHRVSLHYTKMNELKSVTHQLILRFKYKVIRVFQGTFISTILPGINGTSKVTTVSPIGPYSAQVISGLTHAETKILDSGVPKYVGIKCHRDNSRKTENIVKIVYFTSAFRWHDKMRFASYQTQDLKSIIHLINDLPSSYSLTIKTHPRDCLDDEVKSLVDNCKIFESTDEDTLNLLQTFDCCLGNISTVLAEGELYGSNMTSVLLHFPINELENSFVWKLQNKPLININDVRLFLLQKNFPMYNSNSSELIYKAESVHHIVEDMLN